MSANTSSGNLITLLGKGNLAAAESISRTMLQNGTSDWREALGVLASLTAFAGYWGYAERYLAAQRVETAAEAKALLNSLRFRPRRQNAAGRYLIATAWGCGLWSDLNHVLGCALVAELTGREFVVHWGSNSLYNESSSDVFSFFFQGFEIATVLDNIQLPYTGPELFGSPVIRRSVTRTPTLIDALRSDDEVIISDRYIGVVNAIAWSPDCLWPDERKTTLRYQKLSSRYLRPRPSIKNAVEKFVATQFQGYPFIAIHLRGTDKRNEVSNLDEVNCRAIDALRTLDPALKIFAMTDDASLLADLQNLFPGRVVSTGAVRSRNGAPVHVGSGRSRDVDEKSSWIPATYSHATRLAFEVLLDTYVAINADTFIGNGRSNVSASIALLRKWDPGKCILLGRNQLLETFDWKIVS